jgi:hypothetical protein
LTALQTEMDTVTSDHENQKRKNWEDPSKTNHQTAPGYPGRTRDYGQRTSELARRVLQIQVALEWLASGGVRALVANLDDLASIDLAFTKGAPETAFIQSSLAKSNPHRKRDLQAILDERGQLELARSNMVKAINDVVSKEKNQSIYNLEHSFSDPASWASQHPDLNKRTINAFRNEYQRLHGIGRTTTNLRLEDITPTIIASARLQEDIINFLSKVMTPTQVMEVLKNGSP